MRAIAVSISATEFNCVLGTAEVAAGSWLWPSTLCIAELAICEDFGGEESGDDSIVVIQ